MCWILQQNYLDKCDPECQAEDHLIVQTIIQTQGQPSLGMFLNEVNASWEQLDFFSYSPYTAFRNTHGGSYGSTRLPSGTQFSFEGLVDLSFILDNLLNLCIVQHSIFQIGLDIDVIYLNMLSDQCTSDMKSTASLF